MTRKNGWIYEIASFDKLRMSGEEGLAMTEKVDGDSIDSSHFMEKSGIRMTCKKEKKIL